MAEARQVDEWNRVSLMCVIMANPHRDIAKRKQPFEVRDFHPFLSRVKKRKKSAAEIFAKLESLDGVAASVVTGEESWVQKT